MESELPHFNAARRQGRGLWRAGLALAIGGIVGSVVSLPGPWLSSHHFVPLPGEVALAGAALLIAAAGPLSAAALATARRRAAEGRGFRVAAIAQVWLAALPALAGLALGAFAWRAGFATQLSERGQIALGGLLVALAFPALVAQRHFAAQPVALLPEAPALDRLLRLPVAALLGCGLARLLAARGLGWAVWLDDAVAVVAALVAVELLLRAVARLFLPAAPLERRRAAADSVLPGLLALSAPAFRRLGGSFKSQFGIDLSRSWALAYLRRAAPPAAAGTLLLAWLVSGVSALGLDQRAVYERFGRPVAVLGPGLHLHLPWPFGTLRPVELGVVHEIPIVAGTDAGAAATPAAPSDAEAVPPPSADRLWDATHPGEASYLIASAAGAQQSFQIVDVDLRVVWRVGLDDRAALAAAYAVADPETVIRAEAGRELVRFFAGQTLLDVIGANREAVGDRFRTTFQSRLDALGTGIEVIDVIVEAIHPPPGAASAYHFVQAAEIIANSRVALRRGDAERTAALAGQAAHATVNDATAAAAEEVDQAEGEGAQFDADRTADARDGAAFLFERWLARLAAGLVKPDLLVVDHRLAGQAAPTIDLRDFAFPGAGAPADSGPAAPPATTGGGGPPAATSPPAAGSAPGDPGGPPEDDDD